MHQFDRRISEFLTDLASRAATPGGGSASALVGAVAAALCAMVGRLNDKKDGAAGALHETIATADALRARLESLIDEDIAAFDALAASWKLPDDSANAETKQAAIVLATKTPLEIMWASLEVMGLAVEGLEMSKKNCLSDAGVAGLCAHAALESARLNVMINLPGISDEAARAALRNRAEELRSLGCEYRKLIDQSILKHYS
jgi:formiminotetrahydrofolate cyclodeaminase